MTDLESRVGPAAELRAVTPTTILAERLRALRDRIHGSIDERARAELDACLSLAGDLDPYLESVTSPPSEALRDLHSTTLLEDWEARHGEGATAVPLESEMLSGHVEGQLLRLLAQVSGARNALEIGMFTGYASLAIAEALPGDGRLVACELDPFVARLAREVFDRHEAGSKIDVRVGSAAETLRSLRDSGDAFDLAFVDADKAGYGGYYDALLGDADEPGLVRVGGLVCVDNTLYQGEVYAAGIDVSANGRALMEFNERVAADPRVEQVVLPLRDGVTIARRIG